MRRTYPEIPPRVEYEFTDCGRPSVALVKSVAEFARDWD
ncbi:MAG: winged helix-turn-helix transcriptional regulator [Vicinamibacterales bacterium]